MAKCAKVIFPTDSGVYYEHSKRYFYLFDEDQSINVGDFVVVEVSSSFKIVKVMEITEEVEPATKFIVDKIDFAGYNLRKGRAKRIETIRKALDSRCRQIEGMAMYDLLASVDSSAAELVHELKKLMSGSHKWEYCVCI